MKTVNAQGLKEIRDYLSDLHKQETDDEGYDIEFFDTVDPVDFGRDQYRKNHDCKRSGCTVCVAFEH